MAQSKSYLALDVGERRIGVALGDSSVRIAIAYETLLVDGSEIDQISQLVARESIDTIVVGYPRNQSGETTAQTRYVEDFANKIKDLSPHLLFQDESLTSVHAEQRLKQFGGPYTKADIDMQAAAIILQDYLDKEFR